MDKNSIRDQIDEFLNIPYLHCGRTLQGLDCIGLVSLVCHKFGYRILDNDGKPLSPDWYKSDPDRFLRGLQHIGRPLSPGENLQALDIVYFKIGPSVTHAGLMIDSQNFLHVMIHGVSHIARLDYPWHRRLVGVRRVSG